MPSYTTTPLFSIQETAHSNQPPRIYKDQTVRSQTSFNSAFSKEHIKSTPKHSLSHFKSHVVSFGGSEEVYREELQVLLSVIESFDPRYDSYFDSSIMEEDPRTTAHRKQRNDFLHSLVKKIFNSHQTLAKILTCSTDLGLVLLRFSEWTLKAQPLYACYLDHYHLNPDASSSEIELRMQPITEVQRLADFIAVSRNSVFSLGAQPQIRLQDIISNLELASERFVKLAKKSTEKSHGEKAKTSQLVSFSSVKSFVQLSPVCSSFDLSNVEAVFNAELFYKNEKLDTAVHFPTVDLVFFKAASSDAIMLALIRVENDSKSLLFPPFRHGELVFCRDVENFVVLLKHCLAPGVDLYVSLDKKAPDMSTQARCKLLEMFPSRSAVPSEDYSSHAANGLGVSLPMKENMPPNEMKYPPSKAPVSNTHIQYRQSCTQTEPQLSLVSKPIVSSSSSTLARSVASSTTISVVKQAPLAGTFAAHLAKKRNMHRKASNSTKSTSSSSTSTKISSSQRSAESIKPVQKVLSSHIDEERKSDYEQEQRMEEQDSKEDYENAGYDTDSSDSKIEVDSKVGLDFTLDPKEDCIEQMRSRVEKIQSSKPADHNDDVCSNDVCSSDAHNGLSGSIDEGSNFEKASQISSSEIEYKTEQSVKRTDSSNTSSDDHISEETGQRFVGNNDDKSNVVDFPQPEIQKKEKESTSSGNAYSLSKSTFDPQAFAKTYEDALLDAADFDNKPKSHKLGFFSHLFGKKRHSSKSKALFAYPTSKECVPFQKKDLFTNVNVKKDEKSLQLLKSIVAAPDQFYLQDVRYSVWGENGWSAAQLVKLKWVHTEDRQRYIVGYLLDDTRSASQLDGKNVAFMLLFSRDTFVRRAGAFDVQIRSKNYLGSPMMLLLRASSVVNLHKLLDIFSCEKEATISNSSSQQTDFSFIAESSSSHTALSEMAAMPSDISSLRPRKTDASISSRSPVCSISNVSCSSTLSNKSRSSMLRHGKNMVLVHHSIVKLYRLSSKGNKMESMGNVVLKVADYNSSTEMQYLIRSLKVSIDVDLPNEALTVVDSSKLLLDLSAGDNSSASNIGSYILSFGTADDMNDLLDVIGYQ